MTFRKDFLQVLETLKKNTIEKNFVNAIMILMKNIQGGFIMKRKMLISIALITVMLLNCMLPLFVVNAAEGEEIQLNSKLYVAVKASLEQQGISFECNDITHTLTLSSEVKSSITRLNLNEGAISDLTGLDAFSSLTHLELSGNNLTKESNLAVLNNLTALNYLDLSTNQLDDVSEISSLISSLKTEGTIVLSGQTVTQVNTVYVDSEEESDMAPTSEFELPAILELAGYIKSCWKTEERFTQSVNPTQSSYGTPSIASIPMYVTADNKNIEINIANENGYGYYGLVKLTIYIYDDATEAAQANNPNKASENILNGSRFYLYYVVHDSSSEAITTMDTNLYKAIKEQLTGGQTVNSDLSSYPYAVDVNGDIIYEEFTYTTTTINSTSYQILTSVESDEIRYAYDPLTKRLYTYDGTSLGSLVDTIVEPIEIKTVDEDGNISIKAGYKVAYKGDSTGETLYIAAYDEAKTFVIDDLVLTNKITSLILNNKQIRDLSGIEYFIGLCSELNVSHNYLSDIEPIYRLEDQKAYWEAQMIEKYTYWLKTREYGNLSTATSSAKASQQGIESNIKSIKDANTQIINLLKAAAELDSTKDSYATDIKSKADSILEILKTIYGYTNNDGDYVKGYVDNIEDNLRDTEEGTGLYYDISDMYLYLGQLYALYNNEYKLTTLLSDNLNYQTYEEYETYQETIKASTESAKTLLTEQISYLKTLENNNGLSDLDKALFTAEFGIDFTTDKTDTPLGDYFDNYLEKTALNRVQVVELLDTFREIGIYSEMANYCLIKRMNEDTAENYCYEKEYLESRITEFGYEDIPSTLETDLLNAIEEEVSYSDLYDVYEEYTELQYEYADEEGNIDVINTCKGAYKEVDEIIYDTTNYTSDELIALALEESSNGVESQVQEVLDELGTSASQIIKVVNLYEYEDEYIGEANELVIYNQMVSLANKLLNGNIDRYVTLPRLKKLDISYNADLDNLEGITTLTSLSDLNAAYCYIADITNIDWASMTHLRRLNLAYNYISDISALTELTNLKYLNLSNNLIAGNLEISEQQYEKLFKKLEELDLSGNQITDITSLLIYLDYITNGNYANYLAREDTININLNNQNITMEITDPIYLSDYPTTIDVELPKIFTQLLAIDTERTGFGETSQNGRIESEGTYVTLNTRTVGEKNGVVVVLPMTGNGTTVDTCVGAGTTATIKYKVTDRKVTSMSIDPSEDVTVKAGETLQFTAVVEGENLNNTNVTWEIEGNTSEETTISEDGLLTVGADEEAETISVIAVSQFDTKATATATVSITASDVEDPVDPVDPEDPTDPTDPTDSTDPVDPTDPVDEVINTEDLGYELGEEYVTGISPKTPVEDFKTILLNGQEYNVVVIKKDENDDNSVEVTSGYMTTGMYVRIEDEDGNTVKDQNGNSLAYQVIVKGDINGDGLANSLDSVLIKAYRNEIITLSGTEFAAADINEDGNVNVTDSKLLLYHRAEVKGYDLNYSR